MDDWEYDAYLVNPNGLCCCCGEFGRVSLILDPFLLEINDEEDLGWWHSGCAQERWEDT